MDAHLIPQRRLEGLKQYENMDRNINSTPISITMESSLPEARITGVWRKRRKTKATKSVKMIPTPLDAATIPPKTELKERKFSSKLTHLLL